MTYADLLDQLETALRAPLPGAAAQVLMGPRQKREWAPGYSADRVRHAAGLLLLFPLDTVPYVILTIRAHTLDRHGGQVSLPGGVVEPGETFEEAALREAHEEIGLAPDTVRLVCALTPVDIPVSGFRLHPIVAAADRRPDLHPSDAEVAAILEVPVSDLMNPKSVVWRTLTRDGRTLEFPAFPAGGAEIWGATAMVLAEFLALLGWRGPHNGRSADRA